HVQTFTSVGCRAFRGELPERPHAAAGPDRHSRCRSGPAPGRGTPESWLPSGFHAFLQVFAGLECRVFAGGNVNPFGRARPDPRTGFAFTHLERAETRQLDFGARIEAAHDFVEN